MSYTAKSLEEIAAMFDTAAAEAEAQAERQKGTYAAHSFGAAYAWSAAAEILRRTTITEPVHMEKQ